MAKAEKKEIPELIVIFRKDRGKNPEVTAVFPTEVGGAKMGDMTCYAHIGQHSGCSYGWYLTTRRARPEEYADLLAELRQIYEEDPDDPVRLVVRQRISPQMRAEYDRQYRSQFSKEVAS
jgi:hypothetical protein